MCGIAGLFTKTPALQDRLGALLSDMLIELSERGPDSAGVAVYRNPVHAGETKLVLFHDGDYDWTRLADALRDTFPGEVRLEVRASHAVITLAATAPEVSAWLRSRDPRLRLMSSGDTIEIYKEKGPPADVVDRFALRDLAGTHALGHTRMATESAVTTAHSHPFSTGLDLCLVHNGSLSNHNRLRRQLERQQVVFETDNDTEVAAGYLTWRLTRGEALGDALQAALRDLDGFYTFAIGTRDGFAVLRDPIACKPAVLAETDDWVAMASEFRAIAKLPGAEHAEIWEPEPARIYSWSRAA